MPSEELAESPTQYGYTDIQAGTYTALRLQHASVEHLNLTTRRCFVGPIPEGWLKSHRKSWYQDYFDFSNYSSRAATFTAGPNISHHRQITGLDGPSVSAAFGNSFPQPEDVNDEDDESRNEAGDGAGADSEEIEEAGLASDDDEHAKHANRLPQQGSTSKQADNGSGKDKGSKPAPSFVTAPLRPKGSGVKSEDLTGKSPPAAGSFVTAHEFPKKKTEEQANSPAEEGLEEPIADASSQLHPRQSTNGSSVQSPNWLSNGLLEPEQNTGSTTQLLRPEVSSERPNSGDQSGKATQSQEAGKSKARNTGLVKFKLDQDKDSDDEEEEDPTLARTLTSIGQAGRQRIWKRLRRGTAHPGEIVKMEKMLVRVDSTLHDLPKDFNENDSLEIVSRAIEKWSEFVVVCRESTSDDCQFFMQLYKTRVIPAKEELHVRKQSAHEIRLIPKTTRVNLYSSLDKTVVLWLPHRKHETLIYILRPHSATSATEWYTFLRNALGWRRSPTLLVSVPDLKVTLRVENPFNELEKSMNEAQSDASNKVTMTKTMDVEKAISHTIIQKCLKILEDNPEWADVLSRWLSVERIGLAWKRYDRLEWVHGANEQRMYGTMAMQRTHDLELRPKDHYPTAVKATKETITEPAPVEGFLVRLTSQKGTTSRFGRMYFKRLYFATHNQYLCYTRPARALPPPNPELSLNQKGQVPTASEIIDQTPLIFAVNPYPDNNNDGEVDWLQYGTASSKEKHDREAYKESERQIGTVLNTEGFINLSHVIRVQNFRKGNFPVDENLDGGSEIDFHQEVTDTARHDGKTRAFDESRTFELVLKNDLVIRLQAYNEITKREWMHRLRDLIRYWKLRLTDDVKLLKTVREENLERLDIDEEMEAYLGQFGEKWEVTRSLSSSKIFNMCGISSCRAITMSGVLYYKPRRHTTFVRCTVILCHGQLMIFQGLVRSRIGREVGNIQHDRLGSVALQNCYIYSGLITGDDLLYQNETFDSSNPGHNALPKVYLEDGWTSQDEDTMTCFVVWQPRNKSWFRASEEEDSRGKTRQRMRHVSRLGKPGRAIVFRTRSRAERDHWVMSISLEIERMQSGEDIRVVDKAP